MLHLPWLAALVYVESGARGWDMLGLLARVARPTLDDDHSRSLEERMHERAVLLAGLDPMRDQQCRTYRRTQARTYCRRLPATWLLRAAHDATRITAVFESRYPGALTKLALPTAVGIDAAAWSRWPARRPYDATVLDVARRVLTESAHCVSRRGARWFGGMSTSECQRCGQRLRFTPVGEYGRHRSCQVDTS